MIRKQIYITRQQQKMLHQAARATGKSEAEVIRDILDEHQSMQKRRSAWDEIVADIVQSRKRLKPGPDAPRTWKRADLYDRHERSSRHKRSRLSA